MIFENIKKEYNQVLKEQKRKVVKIWSIVTLGSLIGLLISAILYTNAKLFMVMFFLALALLIISGLTTVTLALFYSSEKPLFNTLYPQIINDININENKNIEYQEYPEDKEFIKKGGLFPSSAIKKIRYKIAFKDKSGSVIEFYDAYIYTQADKAVIVHFNGLYVIVKEKNNTIFQLRSKGKPKLKKHKFNKLKNRNDIKEYCLKDNFDYIGDQFYTLYDFLKKDNKKRNVYISGINNEIHIGIENKDLIRKCRSLNKQRYRSIKEQLDINIQLAEKILNHDHMDKRF